MKERIKLENVNCGAERTFREVVASWRQVVVAFLQPVVRDSLLVTRAHR